MKEEFLEGSRKSKEEEVLWRIGNSCKRIRRRGELLLCLLLCVMISFSEKAREKFKVCNTYRLWCNTMNVLCDFGVVMPD